MLLDVITDENDENGVLRKQASEIAGQAELVYYQELIDNMIETMRSRNALGLAAPQIGVSKRIFVLRDGTACINPEIIGRRGKVNSFAEGCLSVSEYKRYDIKRSKKITLKYLDREGKTQILKPRKNIDNIVIQHEMDHLNGTLVCDKGNLRS